MPAGAAVLTPFSRTPAHQQPGAVRRYLKRILPIGEIDYKGRRLQFTQDYLAELAGAFRQRAYDQVPFQLAPGDNSHTNDVERFGGQVEDMVVDPAGPDGPGLYTILAATERGAAVLDENPQLGVSARIVEEYARSDGRFFPAAIQHVLGTLDPRITGLGAWRAIEAASDVAMTVDLSNLTFAGEQEGAMPDLNAEQQARLAQLLDIPADQWAQVVAGLTAPALTEAEIAALTGDPAGQPPEDDEAAQFAAWFDSLTDEQVEQMEADLGLEAAGAGAPAAAGLSFEDRLAIEMANTQAADALQQLRGITSELDDQRYEADVRRYLDMGVPRVVVDKFAPLLRGAGHTIELANGQRADAGQIARDGLTEYARVAQLLDLSGELGSGLDEPGGTSAAAQARDDLVSRAKAAMGFN